MTPSSTEGDFASPGRLGHVWKLVSVVHHWGLSPAPRGGDTAKHPASHGPAPLPRELLLPRVSSAEEGRPARAPVTKVRSLLRRCHSSGALPL